MRKTRRTIIISAIGVMAFLAPATTAYALWSTSATATLTVSTAASAPVPPGGITCQGNRDSISLSWPAVPGATEYRIYRLDGPVYVPLATTTITTSPAFSEASMLEPQNPNNKYNVVVRSYSSAGSFAESAAFEIRFKQQTGCS